MAIDKPDNKVIVKNATMLTIRMVIVAVVGLYTSRVVLGSLGDIDFGIYGVVSGVVALGSFLNTSMAGATSRFITYELGSGNSVKLRNVFSTSLLIHFAIAMIVVILAETAGLWFVNNKMSFPENRMFAVNILYQLSVASIMVSFTQVPYAASIIAHEKMGIYAYIEIVFVSLKLLVVMSLAWVDFDKLIYYGIAMFIVNLINALLYRWYCIRNFQETKFRLRIDRRLTRAMCKFFGLDLYGNMCVAVSGQTQPILLNMFFGVIANTGASIAGTVNGILLGLIMTINQAFKPQITKQYAVGNICEMNGVMLQSVKFTTLAYSALIIPFMLAAPRIIHLWLGQVPVYTVIFLKITILSSFMFILVTVTNTAIHATGDIRRISYINGSIYLITPLISYFLFKFNCAVWSIYVVSLIANILVCGCGLVFLKIQIPTMNVGRIIAVAGKIYLCILISFGFVLLINEMVLTGFVAESCTFIESLFYIALVSLLGLFFVVIMSLAIVFTKSERKYLVNKLKIKVFCLSTSGADN